MNLIDHFRRLFIYNDWANRRALVSVRDQPSEKARRTLAHILVTEREYYARLHGKDSTGFDFWPDLPLVECGPLAKQNSERFEALLSRFDDEGLGLRTAYRTSEGVRHENTYGEILTHVLLHSATHRGNIVATLRAEGLEPPKVDYIIYLRENG